MKKLLLLALLLFAVCLFAACQCALSTDAPVTDAPQTSKDWHCILTTVVDALPDTPQSTAQEVIPEPVLIYELIKVKTNALDTSVGMIIDYPDAEHGAEEFIIRQNGCSAFLGKFTMEIFSQKTDVTRIYGETRFPEYPYDMGAYVIFESGSIPNISRYHLHAASETPLYLSIREHTLFQGVDARDPEALFARAQELLRYYYDLEGLQCTKIQPEDGIGSYTLTYRLVIGNAETDCYATASFSVDENYEVKGSLVIKGTTVLRENYMRFHKLSVDTAEVEAIVRREVERAYAAYTLGEYSVSTVYTLREGKLTAFVTVTPEAIHHTESVCRVFADLYLMITVAE
ncbi:MAG: hypothetical protein IJW46_07645 [Clostridia bacterium]|nr:hypothetical protein [Clostridia bacterium]